MIEFRRLRWAGNADGMEECRSGFKILADKTIGKRPLGRPRRDERTILHGILKK